VLQNSDAQVFALHLRLGQNLLHYRAIDEDLRVRRLTPLSRLSWDDPDLISALYPRHLALSDFGTPLHLEGLVARRADVVSDLRDVISGCGSAKCVESRWMSARMKSRSQQWQASQNLPLLQLFPPVV